MQLLNQIYLYLICLGTFLVLDFIWLGVIARGLYREELGKFMAESPNWAAAAVFYLLFIVGILVFVVNPGLQKDSLSWTLGLGFLFGVITYATYDLTNLATIADWPLKVTVIDLIWGGTLSVAVSVVGYVAYTNFIR